MNHHTDPYVVCPFDNSHRLPSLRIQFHIAKCEPRYKAASSSNKVFRCKFNNMHIFTDEESWKAHETTPGACQLSNFKQTLHLACDVPLVKKRSPYRRNIP